MTAIARKGPLLASRVFRISGCAVAMMVVHCGVPERKYDAEDGSGGTSATGGSGDGGLGGGTPDGGGAQGSGSSNGAGGSSNGAGGSSNGGSTDGPACEDDTDYDANPENCGVCGRTCGNAACVDGACEAEQYYSAGTISGIAAGGGRILVHDGTTILDVIGQGSTETVTEGSSVDSMATDGDFVYWSQAGELWRTEISTGSETSLAASGALPLVQGDYLYYQSGERLIRRLDGRTNTGSQNLVEVDISLTLDAGIPFSTDGDITAYGIDGLGLHAAQGDVSENLLEHSVPPPRGVTAYGGRVYFLDGSGMSSVSFENKTPAVVGDFTYGDGRLRIADDIAFALVWSHGAQGSCSSVRLLQVPLAGGEPIERWTMTYTCGVALALDGEHVYFLVRPGPSSTNASPLAQPTLFRLRK